MLGLLAAFTVAAGRISCSAAHFCGFPLYVLFKTPLCSKRTEDFLVCAREGLLLAFSAGSVVAQALQSSSPAWEVGLPRIGSEHFGHGCLLPEDFPSARASFQRRTAPARDELAQAARRQPPWSRKAGHKSFAEVTAAGWRVLSPCRAASQIIIFPGSGGDSPSPPSAPRRGYSSCNHLYLHAAVATITVAATIAAT